MIQRCDLGDNVALSYIYLVRPGAADLNEKRCAHRHDRIQKLVISRRGIGYDEEENSDLNAGV